MGTTLFEKQKLQTADMTFIPEANARVVANMFWKFGGGQARPLLVTDYLRTSIKTNSKILSKVWMTSLYSRRRTS